MQIHTQDPIAVVGAGTMGAGIAQVAAAAGHPVTVIDQNQEALERGRTTVEHALESALQKGRLDAAARQDILDRITWSSDLSGVARQNLVIEAIVEQLEPKRHLTGAIARVARADTVIATNTSSLGIGEIAAVLAKPERFLGLHFFNPVPAMKLVEIVAGPSTAPEIVDEACRLMRAWGKEPVRVRDIPGFIVNRVARPYYAEGFLALDEGLDPALVDAALVESGGFRMGPLALADLIGHDVNFAVASSVFEAGVGTPRFRPQAAQEALVRDGYLGRKSGRGVYDYDASTPAPAYGSAGAAPSQIRVADAGLLHPLIEAAERAGLEVVSDAALPVDAFAVDGTVIALGDGRKLAERADTDVLFDHARDFASAKTVLLTAASQLHANRAQGFLDVIGRRSLAVADRPGQIVLRVLAQIANAAADTIADQIASGEDVDTAMRFGANHPEGPLTWARRAGNERVRTALANLARSTGDALYAPSRLFGQT